MTRCVPRRVRAGSRRAVAVVRRVEPVGAPLPHVAGHVVQPEAVRREGVDRRRAGEAVGGGVAAGERALEDVHQVLPVRLELVAPREHRCRASPPRAAYSHSASVGRRVPVHAAVRRGVVPRDVDDRVVVAPVEIGLRAVRMAPVGAVDLAPPRRADDAAVSGKSSGRKPAKTNDQPKRSASVTWPVASTNAAKRVVGDGVRRRSRTATARRRAPGPRRRPGRPLRRRSPCGTSRPRG